MADYKCVLVYGRSLNLAGIAASLRLDADLDVHLIDPQAPQAKAELAAYDPQTIIYDLTDPPADLDLRLLQERPDILLIGVDPSSDEVLVLTGQRNRAVTAGELASLVAGYEGRDSGSPRGVTSDDLADCPVTPA